MINIFIGYDKVESVAFYTLQHSIMMRASVPVNIVPLYLPNLKKEFWRKRDPMQSNDFSFSRWLVPYLSGYKGWSIFMDCDMLCRHDIKDLWDKRDSRYAVQVVKHNHMPEEDTKYLGNVQTRYAKKNWSSVMLFNNIECGTLTVEAVNTLSGLDLHQFKWTGNDERVGEIPKEWNHLVGYDEHDEKAKLAHFTIGGPYFKAYEQTEFAEEWFKMNQEMMNCEQY